MEMQEIGRRVALRMEEGENEIKRRKRVNGIEFTDENERD